MPQAIFGPLVLRGFRIKEEKHDTDDDHELQRDLQQRRTSKSLTTIAACMHMWRHGSLPIFLTPPQQHEVDPALYHCFPVLRRGRDVHGRMILRCSTQCTTQNRLLPSGPSRYVTRRQTLPVHRRGFYGFVALPLKASRARCFNRF